MTLIFGTTHAAPILNLFELGIQPGQTAAYDAVGQNNINASVGNEAGMLAMYSVKQKNNPHMAYMVEIYADDAAYQSHRATPHFKAYLDKTADLLADKQAISPSPRACLPTKAG